MVFIYLFFIVAGVQEEVNVTQRVESETTAILHGQNVVVPAVDQNAALLADAEIDAAVENRFLNYQTSQDAAPQISFDVDEFFYSLGADFGNYNN